MLSCLSLALLVCFQDTSDPEWTIQDRFRVDFVRLDILALDKNGAPVTDLKKSDFIIKENGKVMDLEIFDFQDYRNAIDPVQATLPKRPGTNEEEAREDDRAQYIFATDLESVPLVEMRKSMTQLRDALSKGTFPQNADYMIYSMESGVLTDGFLQGTEALVAFLNQFEDRMIDRYRGEIDNRVYSSHLPGKNAYHGSGRASTGPRGLDGLESHIEQCLLTVRGANEEPDSIREAARCVSDSVEAFVDDEELTVRRMIGELEALTYRFQDRRGLKTLFLISPGFSLQPGLEATALASYMMSTISRSAGEIPFGSTNVSRSMEEEFKKVTHACIRNRVVFHTFDIFGIANEQSSVHHRSISGKNSRTARFHKSYLRSYSAGLSTLATESGGFHLRAPDFGNGLSKVLPKLGFYYLVGYASPEGKPGKYRKIKIKCKRRGVELNYRRGYFSAD